MSNPTDTDAKTLAGSDGATKVGGLPPHFPSWAAKLAELYFSGTTSTFVLHGNVFDVVKLDATARWGGLAEFLAEQLFGRWDLIFHYDLARGLRCLAGSNAKRLQEMVATANRWLGDVRQIPREPTKALAALDLFVQKNVMSDPDDRVRAAVIIDHAAYVAPSGDRLSLPDQTHLVTLLNWASSPYVKRLNMAFVMIEARLSAVSERLTGNPHVAALEVPLPSEPERQAFLDSATAGKDPASFSDYGVPELARLTAGIALTDLDVLIRSAIAAGDSGKRLDGAHFKELKKRLIERQAQGMLEFVEPKWGIDTVVGHEAAKKRLSDDAELLKRGLFDSVPMGYLFCGPVGTGKTFLAQCVAGSIGIPAVVLKNFRSKYVGETEGNLERVLGVLRSMGPVVVIVDEADAMLGDRDSGGGDSGVSSRVFGMIANQMGDTRYRGKIVWMLLTARPDLLPVDIKRQGRAEVHIPLFYPDEDSELRAMFSTLARKAGSSLADADIPAELKHKGNLSGADIEGILGRALRTSLLAGSQTITKDALAAALDGFMPSTQTLERELQELAAIVECTDAEFLPPSKKRRMEALGGREKLQERITAIKEIVEGR
jgi:AAA+ superfamily predicted ATPase